MTDPQPGAFQRAVSTVLGELVDGAGREMCWVLNPGDPGLLRSLERLSAAAASAPAPGTGASIAAHVDHLRYGLQLLNRWNRGEDPFGDADYSASWRRVSVSDAEWRILRDQLRAEAHAWLEALREPRTLDEAHLAGTIAGVAHLAYHLGAIRQRDRALSGPPERER